MHPQLSATRSRVSPGSPSDPSGDAPGQRSRPVAGPTGVRFGTLAVVASAVAHVGLMAVLASIAEQIQAAAGVPQGGERTNR